MARSCGFIFAALWLLSLAGTKAQTEEANRFTYPTYALSLNSFDTVEVGYKSNSSAPTLYTFCRSADREVRMERFDQLRAQDTTVSILLNFTEDKEVTNCWFNLRRGEPGSGVGVNSINFSFNSTEGERKTFSANMSTSSTSSSSSSPASTASTQSGVGSINPAEVSTSASTSSPSPTSSAVTSANPGLSTGAQAGIGVGVGLVGIMIGAAAAAMVYRRRKKRGDGPEDEKNASSSSSGSLHYPPTPEVPNMSSSLSQHSGWGYYAQVPNQVHEEPLPDGTLDSRPVFSPYAADIVELEGQKYRGTPPLGRQELDAAPRPHEM